MTLDIHTMRFMDRVAEARNKPLQECTPEEARAFGPALAALAGPAAEMARIEEHTLTRDGGSFNVRVYVPKQAARGVLVYYHGGGWVIGSLDEYATLASKLAERASCAVVLVDYRLAPEHRFPVAVDDCYATLEWAERNRGRLAGDAAPLIVAGDSAGGNLSAVMALVARDRGGPRIALQVLVYPATDADFTLPSYADPANQLMLTREGVEWFWNHYVPDKAQRADCRAAPLRANDFSRLPPAVVMTAEHDVLRDEGEIYAERLRAAGVPVDCRRYAGQMHGFFGLLFLPGSELGFQHAVKAIRACIVRHVARGE